MAVHYEKKGHVAHICLEGRGELNLMAPDSVYRPLYEALADFRDDPDLRVAIISAPEDKKAFTAGGDIRAHHNKADGYGTIKGKSVDPIERMYEERSTGGIYSGDIKVFKPVIFAVNGLCLGAGFVIMLALADIKIVSEDTEFGYPEIKLGVMGGSGASLQLTRQLPWAIAMEILLTGRRLKAEEAQRLGFVNKVVPREQLLSTALEIAEGIAENPPLQVKALKELAISGREIPFSAGIRQERFLSRIIMGSEDAKEGPKAFVEHRKPDYKGK